jgi:hypothetical protein
MTRNTFVKILIGIPTAMVVRLFAATPRIQVFKTPTCGCCGSWVKHLQGNGFEVVVKDVPDTGVYRRKYGVPETLLSCHTAIVDGYALEGHVPAAEIHRLLQDRPKAKGLAVPGMPMGSPGMEGSVKQAYSVILFDSEGHTSVYKRYSGQ